MNRRLTAAAAPLAAVALALVAIGLRVEAMRAESTGHGGRSGAVAADMAPPAGVEAAAVGSSPLRALERLGERRPAKPRSGPALAVLAAAGLLAGARCPQRRGAPTATANAGGTWLPAACRAPPRVQLAP